VSQNIELKNFELATVNPSNKTWTSADLFCYWANSIQTIAGFALISSLYLIYNLSSYLVLSSSIAASILVYFFISLIGHPSQKHGLPFPVLMRMSMGLNGARYLSLLRSIVGIFMFGIQTYFLSKAFVYLIRILIFSIDPSLLDQEVFLLFFLGLNIIDWISITLSILVQVSLFSVGMVFNRKIMKFSAITVYIGILIFFLIVLLNDVKISSQAFLQSVNYYDFFDQKNFIPLLTVAGTVFAYFSIIILSYGDFSRHVKNKSELKKGNLSLILNLVVFSFMALFIVSGADALIKQDAQNLSRILTNPTDIIGKMNNLLVTILVLIFIIIASASTNLIANFIPSQYTLINFIPSSISLKGASYTIGFFGFFLGVFWLTFLSQIGILSIIDTLGAFFGPLFGLMICDYYFIKKNKLNNKDIYSLDKNGIYYYSGGWHLKAVYSLILGFIFAASTIWNSNLMFLQSYSWIMGAFIAAIVYYLLAKD